MEFGSLNQKKKKKKDYFTLDTPEDSIDTTNALQLQVNLQPRDQARDDECLS